MHALVGVWTAAPGRTDAQQTGDPLIPTVSKLPGFVQGYWTVDAETGKLHCFIVFDDEDEVRQLKGAIEGESQAQAQSGLSYDRLSIVEVKASASRQAP